MTKLYQLLVWLAAVAFALPAAGQAVSRNELKATNSILLNAINGKIGTNQIGSGLSWDGSTLTATGGAGSGETNTASNLGGGLSTFDSKSGFDLRFNTWSATGDGVNVSSNANLFTLNLDWLFAASQTNLTALSNALLTADASKQNGSGALTNLAGLADTTFTNVPSGGTNTALRTVGGTNFIDTTGELNNWAQFPTNVWNSRQGGSAALTNLANAGTTGNGSVVFSNAATMSALTLRSPAGSVDNILSVVDGSGGILWKTLSNGVSIFGEDVWITGSGVGINFGTIGSSISMSLSQSGIAAAGVDAEFDDLVSDTLRLDTLSSNTAPVNTLGQLADGTVVQIANGSAGSGGETNTASNLGGGLNTYDSKSGEDLRFNTFSSTGDGVNIASNANLFTLNLDWAVAASQTNLTSASNTLASADATKQHGTAALTNLSNAGTTGAGAVVLSNAPTINSATFLGESSFETANFGTIGVTNVNTNVVAGAAITVYGDLLFNTYSVTGALGADFTFTFESVKPGASGTIFLRSDGSARTGTFIFAGGTLKFATNTLGLAGTNFTTVASADAALAWHANQKGAAETNIVIAGRNLP